MGVFRMIVGELDINIVTNPKDIVTVWPKVREGYKSVQARTEGFCFMAEDIYHEIKLGVATLIIAYNIEGNYEGFAVIKDHPFPDGKGIFVWIMHHAGKIKNFVFNMMQFIQHIGQSLGVIRYTTAAYRKGWERKAKQFGYKKVASINYFESV